MNSGEPDAGGTAKRTTAVAGACGRLPLPDLRTGWDEQTGRAEETGPKCRQEVAEPRTAQQKSVPPDLPGWDA